MRWPLGRGCRSFVTGPLWGKSTGYQWIPLTHWGRVTHICVSDLTSIGSDNDLSPGRRQAIIWTNTGTLLMGPLRTNFSEIFSEIRSFSFKKMHLKMSSAKWRPFCFGLNVLQGSTLTAVRLGIPSSFCCRTTWTSVYGCPLVKLRKFMK